MAGTKLLIAVSSPWASQRLGPPIADLARRLDAETVVAHVARSQSDDETESDARQRGEETLSVLTTALAEAGVPNDSVLLFSDDVARAILSTAKARSCTLIVLGLTARSFLQRVIAGDVPSDILRQSELPVLLCPSAWGGAI